MKKKLQSTAKINSLYIHIPFCENICPYCDFPKILVNHSNPDKYIEKLILEFKSLNISHKLKTIYIGGGTPSCINLEKLFCVIDEFIDLDTEYTIEANVLDINETLLSQYKKHHINRISFGIQSLDNDILKILGRDHKINDVITKIEVIKKYFSNINIDLIYGFKELTNELLENELKLYCQLDTEHISTYSLEINPNTIFGNCKKEPMDSADVRSQFDIIYKFLSSHGYTRYEISNFSKPGYESKHNLNYWRNGQYYGIGLGAASYVAPYRMLNTKNLISYLDDNFIFEKEFVSSSDEKKYFMMLNLRTKYGIDLNEYKRKFNCDLLNEKNDTISSLISRKLLKIEYTNLVATYEGSMLLDIILKELF